MSKEEIYEKLNTIFRDIFDDEDIVVTETTNSDDIEDWDSLEHINLISAVEKEFGVKFNIAQVTGMQNVGEMVDIIIDKLG
ncbi:MAG: acyl carrier protein [Lachnospiraceae bacterium]|nr:acyl carrier protein [Lachnospiraceae bacterium]